MNILHLRASNFHGGPERQLHLHARLARRSEFSLVIGSFTERGQVPEFIKVIGEEGIRTQVFDVGNAYDPRAVGVVSAFLREADIHLLCTHDYRTAVIGYLATRRAKARWIAFSRGATAENLKVKLYHILENIIIRLADQLVAVSYAQKRKLGRLLIPEGRVSVVHNAIDAEASRKAECVDLRAKFGLPSDCVICLSGGRFSKEKGQMDLIAAAQDAVSGNGSLRFILFGEGPDLPRARRTIARLGLEGKIVCPGFCRNLLGCLADADLLVNPSHSEGLPNIVLEAMSLRVPVIATSVGGVPELIADNENGLLVPSRRPALLAEAILALVDNRTLQEALADNALETVIRTFSFENQAQRLFEIYRNAGESI